PNCTRKSTQRQKWVDNCRRADLEDKTPDQLNKHYQLCANHFETSMFCRTIHFSPYRTVLRDNATPTIFNLISHLNNTQSRHRKRIKELSEDEIRTLKQINS
uniref:THAP-type domain-containing protein n=1 Tax=Nomascus leucogenys TaxID=61853 RepID=A0A2I3GH77_NOMLE